MAHVNVGRTPRIVSPLDARDVEFRELLRKSWTDRQAAGTAPATVYAVGDFTADFLANTTMRSQYLTSLLQWDVDLHEENELREDDYRVLKAEFWGRPVRMPFDALTTLMNRATVDRARVRIDRWLAPPLIGIAAASTLYELPQFGVFGDVDATGRQMTTPFSKLEVVHATVLGTPVSTAVPVTATAITTALASAASANKQVVVTPLSTGTTITGLGRVKRKNCVGDFLVVEVDVTGGSVLIPSWDVAAIAVKP